MKKMNKVFKIFSPFIRFFDKWLITPLTKLIIKVSDFFKDNSGSLDKLLNKKETLIVVSLLFSLAIFFVIDINSNLMMYQTAEILYNQPVVAEYNEEAYVVEGLPETADITLIGRSSDIYLAKQYPDHEISVDLRDLKPGSHKVSLKYKQRLNSLDYKLDPSTATIVVYEKVSETRSLSHDILHAESLDSKLVISDVKLDRSDVIIKGAEYKLKEVASVKALIDINKINNPVVGTLKLNDVPLVAYDAEGNIVDVEIVPNIVSATIEIESPSKEVPIRVVPKGSLSFGKAIKSLTSNITTVVIYGDSEALEEIKFVSADIDITGLSEDKDFNVNLKLPSGIRDLSVKTVSVKLTIDEATSKEFKNIRISHDNLSDQFKAHSPSEADSSITVVVKGSKELLDSLDASNITAKINLSNLGVGTHEVDVNVTGSDLKLTYEAKVRKVKVVITKK